MIGGAASMTPLARKLERLYGQPKPINFPAERRARLRALSDRYARSRAYFRDVLALKRFYLLSQMTPQRALKKAAYKHDLRIEDITARTRNKLVVAARAEAAFLMARDIPWLTFREIGKLVGLRDHTSVIHAVCLHAVHTGQTPPRGQAANAKYAELLASWQSRREGGQG